MRLDLQTRRFYLGRDYCEAVEAAGGVPVHLGLIPKRDYVAAAVDGLDGVLLPGSDTDVDPARFGEEPHPRLKTVLPEKEDTDLLVIEAAESAHLPILGICFGMQVLNVSRGGSLIQDIEAQVEDGLKHEQGQPLARASHTVTVTADSYLAAAGGVEMSLRVNSHHHQAVRELGRDLGVGARANDGIIESIQDVRPDRFVLGVQWHPELSWNSDETSRRIFDLFVNACRERNA